MEKQTCPLCKGEGWTVRVETVDGCNNAYEIFDVNVAKEQ